MTKNNLLQKLALAGIAGAALFAAPMKADAGTFIIDDFNGTTPPSPVVQSCPDTTANGVPEICGPTVIDPINTVMGVAGGAPGWTRGLSANLISGDSVQSGICYNCDHAHAISNANSLGDFDWTYNGPSLNLSQYSGQFVMFNYGADLADGVVRFTFDRPGFLDVVVTSNSLPATALSGTPDSYMLLLPVSQVFDDLTSVKIEILGSVGSVIALHAHIDNVKLVSVPEAGTVLGLLAVSGLGLGLKRKKQD
jgi:hypothetical protein